MALTGLVAANNLADVTDRERAWDNLGSSLATGDIAIPAPSLDLNFAANKSLVDDVSGNNLITFSRASTGTFVGSNGLIQTAASGVPRFDHNPVTGESLGLLVEESRTNIVTRSDQLTATQGWGNISSGTMVAASAVHLSPDGLYDVTRLTLGGLNSFWAKDIGYSLATVYTLSVYVKIADGGAPFSINLGFLAGGGGNSFSSGLTVTEQWTRVTFTATTSATGSQRWVYIKDNSTASTSGRQFYTWGAQVELGSFPTSYIPTAASTVTRAADVASITGANFSGWYNQSQSTVLSKFNSFSYNNAATLPTIIHFTDGTLNNYIRLNSGPAYVIRNFTNTGGVNQTQININIAPANNTAYSVAAAFANNDAKVYALGSVNAGTTYLVPAVNKAEIGNWLAQNNTYLNGRISRLTYWPSRLNDKALQYITQPSITSIDIYSFSFAIKGRDILALEDVRNTSTRDFIFIKGLLSAAQPRLTAAAVSAASGLALASNALLKIAPVSSGNYFFASGLTLSGVTTRINGTNALSIATSPFSGSTATARLLFRELHPQANWRITEPMPSGTIATPDLAIPFETNDFVLFMKAGQN